MKQNKQITAFTSTPSVRWAKNNRISFPDSTADLVVGNSKKQTIRGFGGCFNELGWVALESLSKEQKSQLLDELFSPGQEDGLSLSLGRIPIGASDYALEWYAHHEKDDDWNLETFSIERDRTYLLPYVQSAMSRNPKMLLFASPWSPPVWMKHPRAHNHGTLRWENKVRDAYALYLVKFIEAYRAEGFDVKQLHIQNEPVSDHKFPSCVWTGAQMRDFIRENLGPLASQRIPETEIWLGTLNGPFDNYAYSSSNDHAITQNYGCYAGTALNDPLTRKYITGVGYQWGGKNALEQTRASWPELPIMQTEHECMDGRNTWDQMLYSFHLMRHYLVFGVESYCWWNLILPKGGKSTWGWSQNSPLSVDLATGQLIRNPEFYLLQHMSKALMPGATGLEITGIWSAHSLAFLREDHSYVVEVCNPYGESKSFTCKVEGLTFTIEMDPQSITTLEIS